MGRYPGKEEEMGPGEAEVAMFGVLIPIVSVVSVFTFITFAVWFKHRSQEREAFYKAETLRRITEASGEGAKAALELMREDDRLKRIKAREGMKIGGLINIGVGVALVIFLRALVSNEPVYLCGLIPGFVGIALLVYALFLAPPVE
ncbi:MAG: DUF6249 domain-containing protein [Terracidiphilus sp.]|jgi:hypothetical protein